jgi:hypothetical protein
MRVSGFITETKFIKRILDHIRKRDEESAPQLNPPEPGESCRPGAPAARNHHSQYRDSSLGTGPSRASVGGTARVEPS